MSAKTSSVPRQESVLFTLIIRDEQSKEGEQECPCARLGDGLENIFELRRERYGAELDARQGRREARRIGGHDGYGRREAPVEYATWVETGVGRKREMSSLRYAVAKVVGADRKPRLLQLKVAQDMRTLIPRRQVEELQKGGTETSNPRSGEIVS